MSAVADALISNVSRLWAPPPSLTVSEWADAHRRLSPESSSAPGQWTTLSYQREPFNSVSDPRVSRTVIKAGTQLLKTEVILCGIGYFATQDPGPILVIQPGDKDANDFSKERIAPMIRDTPVLTKLFSDPKARDADNNITMKLFPGGMLALVGAGSARNVARRAIRFLFCDEIDLYKPTPEGNAISLARKRLATFRHRSKEINTCSPSVEGSEIDKAYKDSDQREFFVPCHACGHRQSMMLKFRTQVRWDEGLKTREAQAASARYYCENITCNAPWDDAARMKAVEAGEWRAQAPFSGVAGFWISELYSPWKQLREIVLDYLTKKSVASDLRTFVNTSLAENWVESGDAPEWRRVFNRRERYQQGVVPRRCLFLTASVDVQDDRLELEVKGWDRNRENWSITYAVIQPARHTSDGKTIVCKTSEPEPWQILAQFLDTDWPCEDGGTMPIWAMAIDTGFRPQNVYDFCRNRPTAAHGPVGSTVPSNRTVVPTKGGDSNFRLVEGISNTDAAQKRFGLKIVTIGTHKAKGDTYDALRLEPDADGYPPGYCHHPEYEQEYFKGLTAETRVVRQSGDVIWRKDGRNEPLDLHVMNLLAAELCVGRFSEATWQELERRRMDVGKSVADLPAVARPIAPLAVERQWAEADAHPGPRAPQPRTPMPTRPIRGRFI